MRQRNDTDQDLIVHTDPPQVVAPGGVVEHDTPLVGLTVLDEPADEPVKKAAKAAKSTAEEATA